VIVLASASPARAATLRAAGVRHVVRVSAVDEAAYLARHPAVTPAAAAQLLARAKAEDVAAAPDVPAGALVLGCDSVFELDGEAFGKPEDERAARDCWRRMRGRSGVLHTGHWLVDTRTGEGPADGSVASATVHFAEVSDTEIEAYLRTGEPLQVAGAFTVDGLGGAFVRRIEGDHHTVVGLSLPLLRTLVAGAGIDWPRLWRDYQPV
jgi:septum formation protein